jgi:biopolymer transport protein ExbB/TolQ
MEAVDVKVLLETGATGAIILLVTWLVRRVFTHTIPRLADDFKESLKTQQGLFIEQLERQRQDFREALSEQRTDFRDSLREERDQLGRKLDRLAEAVETLISHAPHQHGPGE